MAGYKLLGEDASWSVVVSIEIEAEPLEAYNLTVDDWHTYFVRADLTDGIDAVWVHNNCWRFRGNRPENPSGQVNGVDVYDVTVNGQRRQVYDAIDANGDSKLVFVDQVPPGNWVPPNGWRSPRVPDRGAWEGPVGISGFRISDTSAAASGLPSGTVIPFRNGVPDFKDVSVGPNGRGTGEVTIPGLAARRPQGTLTRQQKEALRRQDRNSAIDALAEQNGLTRKEASMFLIDNNLRVHHAGGDRLQLVPENVHGEFRHSGSVSDPNLGQ